jgi:hypothetical protein
MSDNEAVKNFSQNGLSVGSDVPKLQLIQDLGPLSTAAMQLQLD